MGSIICLFPAYSASQSFVLFYLWYLSCFKVKCWIHTFPKRCSHIAMWILILLDHRGRHVNSSPTGVLLFKWIRSFQHLWDQFQVFSTVSVSSVPKLPLFSHSPTLFLQGLRFLNHVSFYLREVSLFFSFDVLIRWFPMKMLNSFKFIILHSRILLRWIQSKLLIFIIFLSSFLMLSHADAPLNHSLLPIHLFWSAEDISQDLCFHSQSVQDISRLLSHSSHLIQPVQSPLSINCSTMFLLSGP